VRVALVVNPTASSVTPRKRVLVSQALAADHDLTVLETSRRRHATHLASMAAAGGAEVVVVLGGDGTLNEAANGLVGSQTALGVLPGGSTNVFARTIGVPKDLERASASLSAAIDRNSVRRIGLGKANDRWFLFHAGLGFDAAVVEQVERRAQFKRHLGHALFAMATCTTLLRHYDRSRPRFAVHLPGGPVIDGYFTIVQNTNPYTFFGPRPFDVAPDASLDGELTVTTLRRLGVGFTLSVMAAALRGGGRVSGIHDVDYRVGVRTLEVRGHGPFPYQVDGDYLGETESLDICHQADVLDLVIP